MNLMWEKLSDAWLGLTVVELLICSAIFGVFTVVAITAWGSRSDSVATLKSSEWACLKMEKHSQLRLVPAGKVTVPITDRREECALWERKRAPPA